jgi:predicted regulator of Ras-like GTPase activity (Roadblock/LC7/MglB family)
VVDEETIAARNQQFNQIAAERVHVEYIPMQNSSGVRGMLLITMQELAMTATKAPNEKKFQRVSSEIATQTDKAHQVEMEIRKDKMLTEVIETQQRLMGQ